MCYHLSYSTATTMVSSTSACRSRGIYCFHTALGFSVSMFLIAWGGVAVINGETNQEKDYSSYLCPRWLSYATTDTEDSHCDGDDDCNHGDCLKETKDCDAAKPKGCIHKRRISTPAAPWWADCGDVDPGTPSCYVGFDSEEDCKTKDKKPPYEPIGEKCVFGLLTEANPQKNKCHAHGCAEKNWC